MLDLEEKQIINKIQRQMRLFVWALVVMLSTAAILLFSRTMHPEWFLTKMKTGEILDTSRVSEFKNGSHLTTGFAEDENLQLVIGNCTSCHSAKLVTQNRATRDGWKSMIEWMQETQGLWELGDNEPLILDYLAKHYGPKKQGRRAPLNDIDWYDLED